MQEINLEEAIDIAKQNAERRGYEEALAFEKIQSKKSAVVMMEEHFDEEKFLCALRYINCNSSNSLDMSIKSSGYVIGIMKKIIRKVTGFIIEPIVNFQNAYNVQNVKCMVQISNYLKEIEECKKKIGELEREIILLKGIENVAREEKS